MSRDLTAAMQSEVQAANVRPVIFAELAFRSSTLRLCNRGYDISWDSQTWLGNGWLRPIRVIPESAELQAGGIQVELSGVDSSLMSLVLSEADQSKTGKIWLGFLDASGAVIADPVLLFKGFLDVPTIDDSAGDSTVVITYESELICLERQKEVRYTHHNLQAFFAGDLGFQYVTTIEDWSGFWGRAEKPKFHRRKRDLRALHS